MKKLFQIAVIKNMKKIIQIAVLIFIVTSCKAQTPVISFDDSEYGEIRGAYYKDTQNFLGPLEGTWLYSGNGTVLKIVLKKLEMFREKYNQEDFYTDYIVGEYQYIKNGVEIQNTLNNLSSNHQEISNYNIYGNILTKGTKIPAACPECQPGEKRLVTFYKEPSRRNIMGLDAEMIFRRFTENGVVKLKVWFVGVSGSYGFTRDGQPTDIDSHLLPYGEYVLTKQP